MATRKRRIPIPQLHKHEPMYGWALDAHARPIPIALALRGAQGYTCPICGEVMIAKKGDVNQHHFAHENLLNCTPETVAYAIAGQWLALELGQRMVLKQPCPVSWEMSRKHYTAELLKDVYAIVENKKTDYGVASLTLETTEGKIRAAFVLTIDKMPDEVMLARFVTNGIPVILLHVDIFRSGQKTLDELLHGVDIRGGWFLLDGTQADASPHRQFITEPERIRQILYEVVSAPPYRYWNILGRAGDHDDVLVIGGNQIWLPVEIWQTAIGGARNKLGEDLIITTQEWKQPDNSTIALYYVSLRSTDHAIAIRRFLPGEDIHAEIHGGFRMRRTTALEIAQLLATR